MAKAKIINHFPVEQLVAHRFGVLVPEQRGSTPSFPGGHLSIVLHPRLHFRTEEDESLF